MAVLPDSFAGDTCYIDIQVNQPGGATPQSLAGWVIWFTAKISYEDTDLEALIFKYSPANGIAIINEAGGEARITIDPEDTVSVQAVDTLVFYDVQVLTNLGEIYTIDNGTKTFLRAVTRAQASGPPMMLPPQIAGARAEPKSEPEPEEVDDPPMPSVPTMLRMPARRVMRR